VEHLTWECPGRLEPGVAPGTRPWECFLLYRAVAARPVVPSFDMASLRAAAQEISCFIAAAPLCIFCTDGGAMKMQAQRPPSAAAIAVWTPGATRVWSAPVLGLDDSSFQAEVVAAMLASLAMAERAALGFSDCKAALAGIARARAAPRLRAERCALWRPVQTSGTAVSWRWVPAHDRSPEWSTDGFGGLSSLEVSRLARELNAAADAACTECMAAFSAPRSAAMRRLEASYASALEWSVRSIQNRWTGAVALFDHMQDVVAAERGARSAPASQG